MIDRRNLLQILGALGVSACAPDLHEGAGKPSPLHGMQLGLFIPGYRPPKGQGGLNQGADTGPSTMITRISPKGDVSRSMLPVRGHAVEVDPGLNIGVMASMNGSDMVAFDPLTLEVIAKSDTFNDERVGGGHALIDAKRSVVLAAERHAYVPYLGTPKAHEGRITVRDAHDLRELQIFPSHGVAPHEIRFLDDGKHLAIAHYGSTEPPKGLPKSSERFIVEPSITVVEIESGKLVHKFIGPDPTLEIRHLTPTPSGIAAIQVEIGDERLFQRQLMEAEEAALFELDRLAKPGEAFLPAPMLVETGSGMEPLWTENPALMRQGLSIVYDEVFDEVIATYPSSHAIVIVNRRRAELQKILRTKSLGLSYPCGLALHPNGREYLVAGSFEDVFTFARGSHDLIEDARIQLPLFRHSHMAAA